MGRGKKRRIKIWKAAKTLFRHRDDVVDLIKDWSSVKGGFREAIKEASPQGQYLAKLESLIAALRSAVKT